MCASLVVDDGQVTRNQLVLQDTALGDLDLVALVGNNDDGTPESNVPAKHDITLDGQVIELDHLGDALEPLLELGDLLECVSELNDGGLREHAARVHDQLSVLERVKIRSDEQKIGAALDGKETRSWNVDTLGATEVLDGGTDGSLELNNSLAALESLVVDNDLEVKLLVLENALDGTEVEPQVVGVEDLELLNGLEVLNVLRGNLGDFEKADGALVVDEGTTLDIGLGLVGDLRDELGLGVDHVLVDVEVDIGTEVVDVGNEEVFLAGSDQAVEETRVVHGVEQVTVTGRIPEVLVVGGRAGAREERLLVDAGVSGLVEGKDLNVVVGVLLDDTSSVVVSVERVHEDKRNVDVVRAVEVLNLSDRKVEECHALTDLDNGLGTSATHGGTETTVELENGKLVENRGVGSLAELGVRSDLLGRWGLDLVPNTVEIEKSLQN